MTPPESAGLELATLRDSAALDKLAGEWRDLCARARVVEYHQDFDWCRNAWEQIASRRGRQLRIVIGRRDGRLVLVWPMMAEGRKLRLLASDAWEYRGAVVEDGPDSEAWIRAAWHMARRMPGIDHFHFQNLREDSDLCRLLVADPAAENLGVRQSPLVRLAAYGHWDDYQGRLPARLVKDQRRQWRRLAAALPAVEFRVVEDLAEAHELLDWMIAHKSAWLIARGKDSRYFSSPEFRAFHRANLRDALALGQLMMARLGNAQQVVSAGFGFRYRDAFIFQIFVFDPHWENYSPSRLFLEGLIRRCHEQGVRSFDFLAASEDELYKHVWADDYRKSLSFQGAFGFSGALRLRLEKTDLKARARAVLKQIVGRLRKPRDAAAPLRP